MGFAYCQRPLFGSGGALSQLMSNFFIEMFQEHPLKGV